MEIDADISLQHTTPSPELLRQMGLRIATLREARAWSQRELGRQIGISSSRLSRLERGRCTARLGELAALRSALGISLDELVFGPAADLVESRLESLARRLAQARTRTEAELVERLMELVILLREEGHP